MKLSKRKLVKRMLLAAIAATTILTCQDGIVHADGASNNNLTLNNDNYILNEQTHDYNTTNTGYVARGIWLKNVYGGLVSNSINNNGIISTGEDFDRDWLIVDLVGGYTLSGNATGNRIYVNGGNFYYNLSDSYPYRSYIYGGKADMDNGTASDNVIVINSGIIGDVYGGTGQNSLNNQVIITGGIVNRVYGGTGYITIDNNGIGNQISGNVITINGGTILGEIVAGQLSFDYKPGSSEKSFVTKNVINVYGNPNLTEANLLGAWGNYGNKSDHNNILNLATPITAKNISYFGTLNFFIPASMNSGGTMLTLTDTRGTDLRGTAIRAAMQGGSSLDTGDTVTLIQSAGTITTDSSTTYGKMSQAEYDAIKDRLPSGMLSDGVSLDYNMTIEKSGDNAIIARIGNATTDDDNNSSNNNSSNNNSSNNNSSNNNSSNNNSSNNNSSNNNSSNNNSSNNNSSNNLFNNGNVNRSSRKLLSQTQLIANSTVYPTLQLVDFMNDKLVDWLPPSSFDFEDEAEDDVNLPDVPQKEPKGYEIFITGSGGSFRTKTGSGSYIESTLKGFDVGFGRSIDYSNGRLVFAPIFEYATGDYDSYLDDGMHGKGSTKYIAGGLIGRKNFKSGLYIEASARGGKTERDFSSDTMTSGGSPVFVHYSKTSAPIFAGHLRIGKQLRLNKNNLLDAYGIYFHTHQGSMNVNLSTGEDYHFSSANAGKVRLGYRLTTRTSRISRIYTGLAFQYEHNSDAVGMYKGRRTPGTGNHGASGMLEFGWMIRPNKNNPWMLDLNATGFAGHQRGVSGTLKLQKEF